MSSTPLVFVYLGTGLPSYAVKSLKLAQRATRNPLVVLADFQRPPMVSKRVSWLTTQSFYNGESFRKFETRSPLDPDFRDGFWLRAAERFFVLERFMASHNITRMFHGELDCVFGDLGIVEEQVDSSGLTGIFMPRETAHQVVASLIFVNNRLALAEVCETLLERAPLGNEMDILGSMPIESGGLVHAFPTAEYLYRGGAGNLSWPVVPTEPAFVVDGAAIGRWLFGVDPRNTPSGSTTNLTQNPKNTLPFGPPLEQLRFRMNPAQKSQIMVSGPRNQFLPLVAVHVHSKIHGKMTHRYVARLIGRANRGKQTNVLGTPKIFYWTRFKNALLYLRITLANPKKSRELARKVTQKSWWGGVWDRNFRA